MSDPHTDHDTVVVKDGGSSTGMILGIIAVIIVLAGAWYFLAGPGANTSSTPTDVNVDVQIILPAELLTEPASNRTAIVHGYGPIPGQLATQIINAVQAYNAAKEGQE